MNEFEIIHKYFSKLHHNKSSLNLNDDVFFDKKNKLIISIDTYNENTHFFNFKNPYLVIKKIIRSSISDLICKGVKPKYFFLSGSGNKNHFNKKNLKLISKAISDEQKFFNIKCRNANLNPAAAVLVCTVRALKTHGARGSCSLKTLKDGCSNLVRHIQNIKSFGVPVIVAINRFTIDTDVEIGLVEEISKANGVEAIECTHWEEGGKGAVELARKVASVSDSKASSFAPIYANTSSIWDKIKTIATRLYRANDIIADKKIRDQIRNLQNNGYGHLPVCIAKTQYSFSTDPNLKGAPENHIVAIRELRLSAGAGFIVVICGDTLTMPGLPQAPAANQIDVRPDGYVTGLF